MPMLRPGARKRGYTSHWERARKRHLNGEPVCRMCKASGLLNDGRYAIDGTLKDRDDRSLHVDHIVPHRGDQGLFWDRANWQTLCADHHRITKQRDELVGFSSERGLDGWPTDPKHPGNR